MQNTGSGVVVLPQLTNLCYILTVVDAEKFVGIRVDVQGNVDTAYCASLGMKINAKLGGVNALPRSPALEKLVSAPFMIMGANVGHPAPGMKNQPSVTSLVRSYDCSAARYEAMMSIQHPSGDHRRVAVQPLQAIYRQAWRPQQGLAEEDRILQRRSF
ncbi:hypothetical protein K503DRAFT_542544 [Rhizopogon vinicolor AM-OR11-026]|uniref:Piwi domain-containing protein n=1 Tax=Rhizopogon vinicolor AM-OR11-026 TaxID=1314800 RepID=A0A1B7NGR7_9AGAM|nr:hypothetical protein K503DRAFT_542544 [Rhizopogon vinicolor AM-OR11-026]